MNRITTIIIEDEKPAARKLQRMLSHFADLELMATLHSVEEGIEYFQNHLHPDLIFSDIMLGDGVSFDIFEAVHTQSFIIYTTAFDQYTLKAFKLYSIDYPLKPILQEDLERAIEKYHFFNPHQRESKPLNLKELIQEKVPKLSRLLVKTGYKLQIVPIEDVACFYSENKLVYALTHDRAYPTEFTLEELEKVLDSKVFFRISRQCNIAITYIKHIHTSPTYKVELTIPSSVELGVSRDRVKDFKDWLV